MANIGKEINDCSIENCRTLRQLRLPLTSAQQDWLLEQLSAAHERIERLTTKLNRRSTEIATLFDTAQEPYEGPGYNEVARWFNAVIAHRMEAESK